MEETIATGPHPGAPAPLNAITIDPLLVLPFFETTRFERLQSFALSQPLPGLFLFPAGSVEWTGTHVHGRLAQLVRAQH